MTNKIIEALKKLDPVNDNHWTADGLPRLDTVKMLAGDQTLTRDSVTSIVPEFSRSNTAVPDVAPTTGETPSSAPVKAEEVAVVVGDEQPTQEAQSQEVGTGSTEGTTEVETLEKEIAAQSQRVHELRVLKDQAIEAFHVEQQKEDRLREQLDRIKPADRNVDAIQSYLAAQREQLEERAARQKMISDSGIDLKALQSNLKSPLDAALSQRRGN